MLHTQTHWSLRWEGVTSGKNGKIQAPELSKISGPKIFFPDNNFFSRPPIFLSGPPIFFRGPQIFFPGPQFFLPSPYIFNGS